MSNLLGRLLHDEETSLFWGHPEIKKLAQDLQRTPAQLLLEWAMSKGFSVIPKSRDAKRMAENLESRDRELTHEVVAALDGLNQGRRLTWKGVDPSSIA